MNDNPQIQELFTAEAKELAATLESAALGLEARPDDAELINEIFRAAHSLKGAAAMVGLREVAALTHAVETMLDLWRAGDLQPDQRHFAALLRSADMVSAMLHLSAGSPQMPPYAALSAELQALCTATGAQAAAAPADPQRAAPSQSKRMRAKFVPQLDAFQWGGDPLLVLRELRGLTSHMQVRLLDGSLPPLAELNPEQAYFGWELELQLLPDVDLSRVRDAFSFFDGVAELTLDMIDDAPVATAQLAPTVAAPGGTRSAPPRASSGDVTTIRVATEKVDKVIDLMGELVIAQAVVRELVRRQAAAGNIELQEAVLQAERHLRDLQERVMSIRMVPVGAAFSRVPRVVRDLAQSLGKQVRLELLGTETELDKTLIDKVADPLMHLVRNALDHGIEPADERRAKGKPETANLRVHAHARGGSVFVEVTDDGRGLDAERIRSKAIERGLLHADAVIGEEQLWKFIFHPGFSTKQAVTEVSGRGVGLDVVQRMVDELGGELQVKSSRGAGSCFRLRMPLTLTILDGLLLCAGSETCVLPLSDIAFSTQIKRGQARTLAGSGEVLDLGNEVLPLIDLAGVLGRPREPDSLPLAVVVHAGGYRYALRVSALRGQTQAVVKSLENHFRRVPGIMGATILGDGRVALILDGQGVATAAGLARSRLENANANANDRTAPESHGQALGAMEIH